MRTPTSNAGGVEAPEWAAHLVRFITEPTQRTYILTYSAGRELCGSYVAGDRGRFRHLLTEQVRVRELIEGRDERVSADERVYWPYERRVVG